MELMKIFIIKNSHYMDKNRNLEVLIMEFSYDKNLKLDILLKNMGRNLNQFHITKLKSPKMKFEEINS
ncbi:unnamed protein product [Paramecium sonneborni]|uniref:Uncharacterized protein n=1 Tax=Paramecium sonneborni TaxID=65129 RepID=A0A8S1RM24_9CILI|nr:unnamed protein product [Paramecium sonneborni]